jgi:hypothetical protein
MQAVNPEDRTSPNPIAPTAHAKQWRKDTTVKVGEENRYQWPTSKPNPILELFCKYMHQARGPKAAKPVMLVFTMSGLINFIGCRWSTAA